MARNRPPCDRPALLVTQRNDHSGRTPCTCSPRVDRFSKGRTRHASAWSRAKRADQNRRSTLSSCDAISRGTPRPTFRRGRESSSRGACFHPDPRDRSRQRFIDGDDRFSRRGAREASGRCAGSDHFRQRPLRHPLLDGAAPPPQATLFRQPPQEGSARRRDRAAQRAGNLGPGLARRAQLGDP